MSRYFSNIVTYLIPLLFSDVPDDKSEASGTAHGVLHPLAVEAHSEHGAHVAVKLEAVQRIGLPRPVQPDHHDVEVLLGQRDQGLEEGAGAALGLLHHPEDGLLGETEQRCVVGVGLFCLSLGDLRLRQF